LIDVGSPINNQGAGGLNHPGNHPFSISITEEERVKANYYEEELHIKKRKECPLGGHPITNLPKTN